MPDPMHVTEHEHGIVRVFAIDAGPEEAPRWLDPQGEDWPLPRALGVVRLRPEDVQVFRASEMGEAGLSGLLAAGHGIDEAQLSRDRARLDAEAGPVAVIRSGAFAAPVELHPSPPLRLLGVYAEPDAPIPTGEIGEVESARPRPAPAPEPPAPGAAEADGAHDVIEVFRPDRDRYIRDHLWLAAIGMVGATAVLWALGNESYWVGAIAALLAVGVRGWYLASEELGRWWELTPAAVRSVSPEGEHQRSVPLAGIARVRRIGSAVQIVTEGGEKLLVKHQADPDDVRERLARAAGGAP